MKIKNIIIFVTSAVICVISCKKPYNPTLISSPASYLVVEGTINSGPDSTFIRLSRTTPISSNKIKPETGAVVTVESDQGASYALTEKKKGMYAIGPMGLDNSHKYRLHIKTSNNNDYLSDLQSIVKNPPIDSVGFIAKSDGINLYVNTHDADNNTRYYLWSYEETWRFHAMYYSAYVSDGTNIIPRPNQVYYCFANDTSSSIILGSSAKLAQDVIFQNPITQVPATSEKLENKYSIKVRQYALTKEAFTFWSDLKKVTEQLGNIFDAQPSQLSGNIHNAKDAAEPVIGYVSVTNVQSKRVFITRDQVPDTYRTAYPYDCVEDTSYFKDAKFNGRNMVKFYLIDKPETGLPTSAIAPGGGPPIGYVWSSHLCTDCTLRGVVQQPDFWR